jgi:EAL domain-containing protein (putative c-di-GMP-specific phosphodiesterase class I)
MDNQQFALWLQPQVEMSSGKVLSAEALLRMQQPDGSWELPEGLIERIESCGLMVTVGYWVLEETCPAVSLARTRSHAAAVGEFVRSPVDAPKYGV